MRIPLTQIEWAARYRPPGYTQEVMTSGIVEGDALVVADDVYVQLVKKYRVQRPPATLPKYLERLEKCKNCEDKICCACHLTDIERRARDGKCPLGIW